MIKSIALLLVAAVVSPAQIPARAANGQVVSGQPNQAPQPTSFDCAADGIAVNSVTGEPIPRARININVPGASSGTVADSSGKWSVSNIACGAGQVTATRPGFLQAPRRPLTLVSGSPVHDVKVPLTPQSVIYGRVLDDQGDPVMGVQISVVTSRVVDGLVTWVDAPQTGISTTNDLGEYRAAGLSKGKFIACAHVNQGRALVGSQADSQTMPGISCYPGPPEGGTASAMDLPPGREVKVDFALSQVPAVHVRGTVSNLPEGRNVGISLGSRGARTGIEAPTSTPVRGGKFDFRIASGSYVLTADYFEGGKRLLARVPIEVGSSDIDNVVVNLDSGFAVTGRVRMESQSRQTATVPQFGINLRPTEPSNGTGQLKWDADHASFTFNDMVPGSYRLDVFPPAPFYVKSATLAGQDVLGGELAVSQAAGPIEIVLSDDGGSIEGDVVNADGQPVAGGVMALRTGRAMTAAPNIHFKLQNLAPGDYRVYAWDDPAQVEYANSEWMRRYGGSGVAVTVTAGQSSQVKLTLQTVSQ